MKSANEWIASELKPSSPFKPRPGPSDAQIEGMYCAGNMARKQCFCYRVTKTVHAPKIICPGKLTRPFFIVFILEIRNKLESRCSPRVFSHQSRAPPSRHSSRAVSQQSVYVPPAQSLEAAAQRPPSHQSIKSQQSVLKSILEYKP